MSDVVRGPDGLARCPWPGLADPLYTTYHDTEWAVPVRGEAALLERLCLEAFQSGLSWLTILRKRPAFREVFCAFDPDAVARFTDEDVARLLADVRIVRNRRKIEATLANAQATVRLRDAGGLDTLVWRHHDPDRTRPVRAADVPAHTTASRALSDELRAAGFRHLGPTTVYAAMQACGVVDDHLADCHRAGA